MPREIAPAERLAASGSETAPNRRLVAGLHNDGGRTDAAIVLLDDVLRECLDSLGPTDPVTLDTRLQHVKAASASGGESDTVSHLEELLSDCIRALGKSHEITTAVRVTTMIRAAEADHSRAIELLEDELNSSGLVGKERELAEVALQFTVLHWVDFTNEDVPISALLDRTLAVAIQIFGKDSPAIFVPRGLIATRAHARNDAEFARALPNELSQDQARVLGPEHPDTVRTLERPDTLTARKPPFRSAPDTEGHSRPTDAAAEDPAPPYGSGTSHNQ